MGIILRDNNSIDVVSNAEQDQGFSVLRLFTYLTLDHSYPAKQQFFQQPPSLFTETTQIEYGA